VGFDPTGAVSLLHYSVLLEMSTSARGAARLPVVIDFAQPTLFVPVNPRQKLVAFRVRTEEYDALRRAVLGEGSGSISEFARRAIFQRVNSLRQIRSRLGAVAQELQRLSAEIRALSAEAINLAASKGTRKHTDRDE